MKIILTGSGGFLASHLIPLLKDFDIYPAGSNYDLTSWYDVDNLFNHSGIPDIIIHLAAKVGGIGYNLKYPAFVYHQNVLMNTNIITEAALSGVKKFIFAGSVCSYPLDTPIPTSEDWLGKGWPEPSNQAYGMSKLMALVQLQACKKQYGMDFSYPVFANMYGPGDSGFTNPDKSHLIPNLIRQFATQDTIEMFGRGTLTRDLLYAEDAARAIMKCIETDYSEPVNIATGQEVSIREIAEILGKLSLRPRRGDWPDIPDKGEQRRCYNIAKAKDILGFEAEISIEEGLKRTWGWYEMQYGATKEKD